ncbi:MAG: hypothetical protein AB7F59_05205 [Bdellovibrionales bacterium]
MKLWIMAAVVVFSQNAFSKDLACRLAETYDGKSAVYALSSAEAKIESAGKLHKSLELRITGTEVDNQPVILQTFTNITTGETFTTRAIGKTLAYEHKHALGAFVITCNFVL